MQPALGPRRPARVAPPVDPTTPEARRAAAQALGTPNPTEQQVARFAADRNRQQSEETGRTIFGRLGRAAIGLTTSFFALKLATRDYTRGVEGAAERLRVFSPHVGAAAARFDFRRLQLMVDEGRRTGGSTAALIDARSRRLEAAAPFRNELTNFGNLAQTAVTNFQSEILRRLDEWGVDDAMRRVNEWLAENLDIDLFGGDDELQGRFKKLLDLANSSPRGLTPDEMQTNQRKPRNGRL